MTKLEEIEKRWADKSWPHIGYFTHAQAVEDIEYLLKHGQDSYARGVRVGRQMEIDGILGCLV